MSNTPLYLWPFSLRYRGYLIVPIQGNESCQVVVFDPFGTELDGVTAKPPTKSFEQVWQVGKAFVDADAQRLAESHSPSLRQQLVQAGTIL